MYNMYDIAKAQRPQKQDFNTNHGIEPTKYKKKIYNIHFVDRAASRGMRNMSVFGSGWVT